MRVVGGRYGLVLERIHAGDGQSGLRQPGAGIAEESFHGRHQRRSVRTPASSSIRTSRIEPDDVVRAQFFGLGADGTVGANKESIKIIGENTDNFAQGYFVYDSKKVGRDDDLASALRAAADSLDLSHHEANFVACHQPFLSRRYDVLKDLAPGGTFLLNTPFDRGTSLGTSAGECAAAD